MAHLFQLQQNVTSNDSLRSILLAKITYPQISPENHVSVVALYCRGRTQSCQKSNVHSRVHTFQYYLSGMDGINSMLRDNRSKELTKTFTKTIFCVQQAFIAPGLQHEAKKLFIFYFACSLIVKSAVLCVGPDYLTNFSNDR